MDSLSVSFLIRELGEVIKKKQRLLKNIAEIESKGGFPFTQFISLFNWEHFDEIHIVLTQWRNCLKDIYLDMPGHHNEKMIFDFEKIDASDIYIDLSHFINHGTLNCTMKDLARFLVNYTNLGESEDNIYMQLKRYKKKYQC